MPKPRGSDAPRSPAAIEYLPEGEDVLELHGRAEATAHERQLSREPQRARRRGVCEQPVLRVLREVLRAHRALERVQRVLHRLVPPRHPRRRRAREQGLAGVRLRRADLARGAEGG